MKFDVVVQGQRVGRDRRPYSRKIYGAYAGLWLGILALYIFGGYGLAGETTTGRVLHWTLGGVAALWFAGSFRIWWQHASRVAEWETTHRGPKL